MSTPPMLRRSFLGGLVASLAVPAVVRASSIMPVRVPPLVLADALRAAPLEPTLEITGFDIFGKAVRILSPRGEAAFGIGNPRLIRKLARIVSGKEARWLDPTWPQTKISTELTSRQKAALRAQEIRAAALARGEPFIPIDIPGALDDEPGQQRIQGFTRSAGYSPVVTPIVKTAWEFHSSKWEPWDG